MREGPIDLRDVHQGCGFAGSRETCVARMKLHIVGCQWFLKPKETCGSTISCQWFLKPNKNVELPFVSGFLSPMNHKTYKTPSLTPMNRPTGRMTSWRENSWRPASGSFPARARTAPKHLDRGDESLQVKQQEKVKVNHLQVSFMVSFIGEFYSECYSEFYCCLSYRRILSLSTIEQLLNPLLNHLNSSKTHYKRFVSVISRVHITINSTYHLVAHALTEVHHVHGQE